MLPNIESKKVSVKLKVCLVGDESVGKTSLIRRFVYSVYDESYIRTIGTMVTRREVDIPNTNYQAHLLIWDIMGRKDFMDLFKEAYFKHAKGIVAVVDLTRTKTLQSLNQWVEGITKSVGKVPTVVLANKADLKDKVEMDDSDIDLYCKNMSYPWFKTSARTGENVERAFLALVTNLGEDL